MKPELRVNIRDFSAFTQGHDTMQFAGSLPGAQTAAE
jgi:hypothetical protein